MKLLALLGVVALTCLSLPAQTVVPFSQANFNYTVQTIPGAIPTSSTCVVGPLDACNLKIVASSFSNDPTYGAPFLCAVDLLGTGQTITIQDGQVTPVKWIVAGAALPATGSTATGFEWHADKDSNCRPFIGGLYIQAGSSGVTGRLVIKYNL